MKNFMALFRLYFTAISGQAFSSFRAKTKPEAAKSLAA
jgi:hypothetical protein